MGIVSNYEMGVHFENVGRDAKKVLSIPQWPRKWRSAHTTDEARRSETQYSAF